MKFLCDACERLVPLETFRTEASGLVVTCGRCGAESRAVLSVAVPVPAVAPSAEPPPLAAAIPAPRSASPALHVVRAEVGQPAPLTDEALFEPPPGVCPKCVAPRREEALACSQCGLVYVNYLPESQPLSDVLADAWRNLAARWEDWDAHDRVMTLAVGRGELAMAGRLYRIRLARAPHDSFALRGRDEVVRRATLVVPSAAEQTGTPSALQRLKTVAVGVGFIVVLVLAVLVFQHMRALMVGH